MAIKLVIFDFDGVLCEFKYESFNLLLELKKNNIQVAIASHNEMAHYQVKNFWGKSLFDVIVNRYPYEIMDFDRVKCFSSVFPKIENVQVSKINDNLADTCRALLLGEHKNMLVTEVLDKFPTLSAEECLFIDDDPINCLTVKEKLGMKTVNAKTQFCREHLQDIEI